jgi:hypothetical protein
MAKTTTNKKNAPAAGKGKEVATTDKKNLPTADVDVTLLMKQDSGKGVSTAAEDNIVPLIYILQAQSPQALKQKPEYIKGATAGMIWPRGTKILIDGEETGMPFIPVAFTKWWIEWRPNRGGYVGRHKYDATAADKGRPEGAEWVEDPKKPGKGNWELESGNVVVETREHAGLAFINEQWTGCVVSMSGSNHTASRAWMGLMKDKKIPGTSDRAPSYAYVYNLKTIAKSNDDGDWYGWQVEDGMGDGEVTIITSIDDGAELYRTARQLNADFESGAKVADAPIEPDDATTGSSDNDDNDSDM